jgi:hypothetical protein
MKSKYSCFSSILVGLPCQVVVWVILLVVWQVVGLYRVQAQTDLNNISRELYISPGTLLHVTGNLTSSGTGASIRNEGSIQVLGNFVNDARYVPSAGRVLFSGSAPQTYDANSRDTVARLVINNAAGVSTVDTLVVPDSITFASGSLTPDKLLVTSATRYANEADNRNVNGNIFIAGTGHAYLPISGTDEQLYPIVLKNIQGANSLLRVAHISTNPAGTMDTSLGAIANTRYWTITDVKGNTTGIDSVRLAYRDADRPIVVPAAAYRVARSATVSGTYTSKGNTATHGASEPYYIASGQLGSHYTGSFTLGWGRNASGYSVIPVSPICFGDSTRLTLLSFEPGGSINWQRSNDNITFTNFSPPQTGTVLNLLDTLTATRYFRAQVTGNDLADGNSTSQVIAVTPSFKGNLKFFLEGPYNAGTNNMSDASLNPTIGPSPVNALEQYTKSNPSTPARRRMYTFANVPVDAVDWVKIELWKDAPFTKVDSAFAWLLKDGTIRSLKNGTASYLNFCNANGTDNYYFVVRHRNHIAIQSANTYNLTTVPPGSPVDLTVAANILGATDLSCAELEPGVYGLATGNLVNVAPFDLDEVNALDFQVSLAAPLLEDYYGLEDANLDSFVNSADYLKVSNNNDNLIKSFAPAE